MAAPSPAKTAGECPLCDGEGFVTAAGDTAAVARLCSHLASCASCRGKGFVAGRDALGYEVLQPCQTCNVQAIKRRVQFFNQAGVPAAYCNATLDNWKPQTPASARSTPGLASGRRLWPATGRTQTASFRGSCAALGSPACQAWARPT